MRQTSVEHYGTEHARQVKLDKLIVDFATATTTSLRAIDSPEFHAIVNHLDRKAVVHSANTIRGRICIRAEQVQDKLKVELRNRKVRYLL